jgi:hypothetical protein
MLLADITTTIAAIFAAVAAMAAWATVATDWLRQRARRQPNVSAGFLDLRSQGRSAIEFVNMGPGLAIQLGWYLVGDNGAHEGGIVGTGHLSAGDSKTIQVTIPVSGPKADFVWMCRDIDQREHVWSYAGEHRRLKRGRYPNAGESFRLMYPDA